MADVRLIDANALKEDLKNMLARVMHESDLDFDHSHAKIWAATITGIQHSIKRLDKAPTIDAVPVVRCRNCRLWRRTEKHYGKCPFLIGEHQYTSEDGFCNLGEKIDGGADT